MHWLRMSSRSSDRPVSSEDITAGLSRRFAASLRAGDGANASIVIREAGQRALGEAEIYTGVITPAMAEIGELWATGVLSTTQERMASMITITQLESLRVRSVAGESGVVVLAAAPREEHAIGLLMVRNLCERRGYQSLLLDNTADPEQIAATVSARRPVLLGLTAGLDLHLAPVVAVIGCVRAAVPRQAILVGGRAGQTVAGSLGCDLIALRRTGSGAEIAELLAPLLSRPDAPAG
jgi:MerR family transcriptional regulator, light-induced transcriptional regulator